MLAASPDNLRLSHSPASSVPFLAGEETGVTKKFSLLSATHSATVLGWVWWVRPVIPATQEEESLSA